MDMLFFLHSIMKKLKNKFIIIVILIITLIVWSQVLMAYSNNNVDTNSYLTLIKWNGTLNDLRLTIEEERILVAWDKIRVIWDSSLAVIQWWDGSLTRLGGNTKISIDQNEISRDYTNINISFELIAGKTWSNVISFIGSDSSFTQTFDGIEAWVRGTVFDVDLDKEFIHVTDHLVELTDDLGNIVALWEGKTLSLQDFSLIDISQFISSLEDSTWNTLNEQFDREYLWELKEELEDSWKWKNPFLFILDWVSPKYRILYELDNADDFLKIEAQIEKIDDTKKQEVYNAVLSKYQSMNFIGAGDYQAYKRKIFYKKALITLSTDSVDTQRLVQSTAYDLQDIVESENTIGVSETLALLYENKQALGDIDMSFLSGWLEYLPVELLEEFKANFWSLSDIFNIDMSSIKNIDSDWVGDLLDAADKKIQDLLEKNVGGLLQNMVQ